MKLSEIWALFGLTKEEREDIDAKDFAGPDRSYPCDTQEHLDACATLIGKAPEDEQPAIKKKAIAIAKRKGLTLPKSWQKDAKMGDPSFANISNALRAAIGNDPDNDGDEDYPWIVDVWGDRFVYSCDGQFYEQGYSLDDDGNVKLIGAPQLVRETTTYEPVTMGFEGDLSCAEFAGDMAVFSGLAFKAGNYPKQKIEMTPEDNVRACANFSRVPIKDTHDDNQSVFKGKLGTWSAAIPQESGKTVDARLEMPAALLSLFGEDWKPKVSVEIDRTSKRFTAIALLNYPQVTEAQVAAAFAGARHSKADMDKIQAIHDHAMDLGAECDTAKMGARHSKSDQDAIQQVHDLAVSQGAICPAAVVTPAAMGSHDPAQASLSAKETQNMTKWERFKARFGNDPKALEAAGITQASFEEVVGKEASSASDVPADPVLAKKIAEFEADGLLLRNKILEEQAAKFANDVIYNRKKALVSQSEQIKDMYRMAVNADGDGGVAKFSSATGDIVEGEKVKQLKAYFEAQPSLAFFGEKIKDAARTDKENDRESRTAARNAAAMARLNQEGN